MSDDRPPARRGFTVIELAIVLAVVAVLVGVAAPDLTRTAATSAQRAQGAEFMATLRYARSEALKRGEAVTVCANDPVAVARRCLGGRTADWRSGWLVFVDRDVRGQVDAPDLLLRVQQPLVRSGGVDGTRSSITYTAAGFSTDAASHYRFDPAPTAGAVPASLLVCVSKQGRPRLAPGELCD